MGLTHGFDLTAWSRWQSSQQPWSRRVRARATAHRPGAADAPAVLAVGGPAPRVVVVLDATTPTALRALLLPVLHLPLDDVAVIAPTPLPQLDRAGLVHGSGPAQALLERVVGPGTTVLALGHYMSLGAAAHAAATAAGATFVTVQHGLLTPHAPPLAEGTTLLAWSDADASFWAEGRLDVTTRVVGSQLLWEAAEPPPVQMDVAAAPVFLGQLHGVELPRALLGRTAEAFCAETGATYRPHPAEKDRRSRATHRRWERRGILVDRSATPLRELRAPVVGIFSTGVLEAAAAGLPAYVYLPDAPEWVRDFWARYGLSQWGDAPTASPERPDLEPSRAIARWVQEMMTP